jgi:hypothetical protein
MSEASIVIPARFTGPVASANGGYACGRVAAFIEGPAEVTLRSPPRLEVPLEVDRDASGVVRVFDGETLVAEARRADPEIEPPSAPTFEEAARASLHYHWRDHHPYPRCFVCSNVRRIGDGFELWPGPIHDRHIVASTWIPDASIDDGTGRVPAEFVWSVLDCPTWHGVFAFHAHELATSALLGRLTASIEDRPRIGERCVVIGWELGLEGKKVFGAAAAFGEDERRLGLSRAVWIRTPAPT